jgi:nicotinate-nucleotide adenylyltransferase
MKIGIFGGTFNPVHYGHLRAAEEVQEVFAFDRLLFVPASLSSLQDDKDCSQERKKLRNI